MARMGVTVQEKVTFNWIRLLAINGTGFTRCQILRNEDGGTHFSAIMVSIIIGYKTEFSVYHSKHKIQSYQFQLSIMLGNRQHMFLIPYWVQITPHYTCLDSLYAIAPNQIYDFSTVNKNKKQQFPKEIYINVNAS